MKSASLILFDYDIDYVNNFLDYFRKARLSLYEVMGFSKEEHLKHYLENQKVDILLSSGDLSISEYTKENNMLVLLLTEETLQRNDMENECIFKYQSVEIIMKKVTEEYIKTISASDVQKVKSTQNGAKIISFYSPYRDLDTSYLSFALSMALAKNKQVLYIDFSLFEAMLLLTDATSNSLSELLYYLKQESSNLIVKLNAVTIPLVGIHCLAGVEHEFDLYQISKTDIQRLLHTIRYNENYDVLICNVGFMNESMVELLSESNKVYMLKDRNLVEGYKKEKFFHVLSLEEQDEMEDQIEFIDVPSEYCIEEHFSLKELQENGIVEYVNQTIGNVI
ncbi:P-loop NTPase family protein [Anaeromicropila herbilytica]|uniref:AAA domain-containing protein n=1 Tax=Anaeromicropila herbilytica TaxID=2785025 RepID=A0A7R7EQ82_9FIRM|nr:hypothetical protein [Anaeromicropila herbilytica]BCN32939.1 hypothetical protein bsdtb5_42340 [Anaeromicropila herbilytica]